MRRQPLIRLDNGNDSKEVKHIFVLKTGVTGSKKMYIWWKGFVSFRVYEAGLPLFFFAVSKRYYDTHLVSVFQRNWIKGWR